MNITEGGTYGCIPLNAAGAGKKSSEMLKVVGKCMLCNIGGMVSNVLVWEGGKIMAWN